MTQPLSGAQTCTLDGPRAHYLANVMRVQAGEGLALFNGRDGEWLAEVESRDKGRVELALARKLREQTPEPGPWLAFAPLKKARLDIAIEKATELGVERLVPVITRRTEVRKLKMERLRAQVIEAAEQCERLTIPEIIEPVALEKLPDVWPAGRKLFVCDERGKAPSLADAALNETAPTGVLVGPVGGFEPAELDWLADKPISTPVKLGRRILRAETASVVALAVLQAVTHNW